MPLEISSDGRSEGCRFSRLFPLGTATLRLQFTATIVLLVFTTVLVNPGMGEVSNLGDDKQIIATEAIRLFPAVVRFVDAVEGNVIARSVFRVVPPDRSLNPPQTNFVNRSLCHRAPH